MCVHCSPLLAVLFGIMKSIAMTAFLLLLLYEAAIITTPKFPCDIAPATVNFNRFHLTKPNRIFLLGDSLMGQMCHDLFCDNYEKIQQKPLDSTITWYYFNHHNLRGYPEIDVYHIFHGHDAKVIKSQLWIFEPQETDELFIHYGAHAHNNKNQQFRVFVQEIYRNIALKFPGRVAWIEPFPQHFPGGIYNSSVIYPPSTDCNPINEVGNMSQAWRNEIVNEIVANSSKVHFIKAYNLLVPMYQCHRLVWTDFGVRDCTHYDEIAYSHVVKSMFS